MIDLQLTYPKITFSFNGSDVPKLTMPEFLELHGIRDFVCQYKDKLQVYVFKYDNECLFKRYSLINGIQSFSKDGQHYQRL